MPAHILKKILVAIGALLAIVVVWGSYVLQKNDGGLPAPAGENRPQITAVACPGRQMVDKEIPNSKNQARLTPAEILTAIYGSYNAKGGYAAWKPAPDDDTPAFAGNGTLGSRIVATRELPGSSSFLVLTKTQTLPPQDCHSCGAVLGGAIFQKDEQNVWRLVSTQKYIEELGAYGDFPDPPALIHIGSGPDKIGFQFDTGFSNQGITETIKTVYAPVDACIIKISQKITEESSSGK